MVPPNARHSERSPVESAAAAAAAAMSAAAESLQARLELVLDERLGALSADQRGFLQVAKKDGQRLLKLIGDFHEIALAEAGLLELEWGRTDVAEAARGAADSVAARAQMLGKSIGVTADDATAIAADAARVAEALRRLVQHAVQHSAPGSEIELSVAGAAVALRYEAESPPPADALGVAFATAIARAHGGSVAVASDGAIVRIELAFAHGEARVVSIAA